MKKLNKEFFKKNLKTLVIVVLLLGILIYKFFDRSNIVEGYENTYNSTYNSSENYVVEVKGEVNRPGLYIVMKDCRVSDIIDLALGFTNNADTSSINLASKITDGMQIIVKGNEKQESDTDKVSINTASFEELKKIPNIGEAKAKNIIKYREENGYFKSIEEIINVSGISENLFEQIKEYICL